MDPNISHDHENENFVDDDQKIDLDDIKGKIFIGGLSWQTSEANLRYYFEKFGELSDVALMIDKRTGKPRLEVFAVFEVASLINCVFLDFSEDLGLLK
jgi:RNA recognition motif-containing protein